MRALTGRVTPGVRIESRRPVSVHSRSDASGPTWPDVPPHPIDHANYRTSERLTERAGPVSDQTRWCKTLAHVPLQQLLLTGRVRLSRDCVWFSIRSPQWPPFASVSVHDDLEKNSATGVVENMYFIFSKTPESCRPQTPLYRSNSTTFANVLTSPSVHHHVHVC
jgi:hypothetical protein